MNYRGRVAPSPTGYLHLGHARTFAVAYDRCRERNGTLVYRDEDLDRKRCKPEFAAAAVKDLKRFGLDWDEGPDVGGEFAPYTQSERLACGIYQKQWRRLHAGGWIYPCKRSRKEIQARLLEQHDGTLPDREGWEPVFPPELRPPEFQSAAVVVPGFSLDDPGGVNWRFRVPDGETIAFADLSFGKVQFTAGADFGDFLVWRRDVDAPAYEFAVVVDDALMRVSEVVRGADLLLSTARQLLLYRALGFAPPAFFHCELLRDADGRRLAKRHDSLALRKLMDEGKTAAELREMAGL